MFFNKMNTLHPEPSLRLGSSLSAQLSGPLLPKVDESYRGQAFLQERLRLVPGVFLELVEKTDVAVHFALVLKVLVFKFKLKM